MSLRSRLSAVLSRTMRTRAARMLVLPTFPPLHLALYRLTRGRINVTALIVPTLVLHSTGAKTGLTRQTPLMCWPEPDGSYLVSGSNWGRPAHPAWTANLLANPHAEIDVKRRRVPVRAELVLGDERAQVWPRLNAQWPNYRAYETDAGREMRIFRLVPSGSAVPDRPSTARGA